ncbi:MAG: ROK family protein [Anaerolineaceae bacterium]|nr:MAG: ROK family protein [Anaerolineaceae bacterium]
MSKTIIGVDLGGTRIRAARLDARLSIIERHETLTRAHEGLEPTLERIKAEIGKVIPDNRDDVLGIGISAPGPLNPETGVIVSPPNLHGWHNVPLGDILKDAFGVPVYTGNDANLAILAEAAVGAAKGYKHAIYVTISTGIGGGMLIDDRLLLGRHGLAAEAGHMVMVAGERVSTLELEAAGPAMAKRARTRIEAGEQSQMVALVDGKLDEINGATVGRAAQAGDVMALDIVERAARVFGMGIVNLLHLFNPEIVVIGGGVSQLGDLLFDPMWESIRAHCIDDAYWRDLVIVGPELGEDVSVIGAATLVITDGGKRSLQDVV